MQRSGGATTLPTRGGSEQDVTRPRWVASIRDRVIGLPGGLTIWRVSVGIVGFLVVAAGIVMLPLPGPGWLVVFLGLGAWATEFRWAGRLLLRVKHFAQASSARVKAMPTWGKALVGLLVLAILAGLGVAGWWAYGPH